MPFIKVRKALLMNIKLRPVLSSHSVAEVRSLQRSNFYICAFNSFLLDNSQYESCRKIVTRIMRKQKPKAKFRTCVKFTLPYTSKSKNARMGKGKGGIVKYVNRLKMFGQLFYLQDVTAICAVKTMQQLQHKVPQKLCVLSIHTTTTCAHARLPSKPLTVENTVNRSY